MYDENFTKVLSLQLAQQFSEWGIPSSAEISTLTVSENATFLVQFSVNASSVFSSSAKPPFNGDLKRIIIRVHRPNYHDRQEIESELAWLFELRAHSGLVVPSPIPALTGDYLIKLQDVKETQETQETLYAVAFEFLSGCEPEVNQDTEKWFQQLGAINARLHQHSKEWQVPKCFKRKYWNLDTMLGENAYWGDWRENAGLVAESRSMIEDAISLLSSRLASYDTLPQRYGLIHADLRLANLLVDNDLLQVIDFDDCGYCWYAYDFAAAISFYETDPLVPELQKAWLSGYRSVAPFAEEDEQELASMILLRRILLTAWLASHAETPTAQEFNPGFAEATAKMAEQYLASSGCSVNLQC